MKALFKGIISSLVLTALGFACVLYLDNKGYFNLEILKVTFIESEQAENFPAMQKWKAQLEEEFLGVKGASLWDLPMSEISAKLTPLDWVEGFNIRRRFPNKLQLELLPKKWIALVRFGSSREFKGLSSQCDLLPSVRFVDSIDLPLVGESSLKTEKGRKAICSFLNALSGDGIVSEKNVANVAWGKEGLKVHLIEPDVLLLLGEEELLKRSKRIERVLQHLEMKSLTPKVITASFQQKVVVKLRKAR